LQAANSIDYQALIAEGLQGKALGEQIQKRRIEAIGQLPRPALP
jgi:hypothetical protein